MLSIFKKLFALPDDTTIKEALAAGALLIDVRTPGEFATGNIKGSINIPVDRLNNEISTLKADKPIIVYCRSGARSMAAKKMLMNKGFKKIVDGGSINDVNKLINTK